MALSFLLSKATKCTCTPPKVLLEAFVYTSKGSFRCRSLNTGPIVIVFSSIGQLSCNPTPNKEN